MAVRRPKHIPIRSCVVCRQTSDKRTLLRVVRLPEKLGGQVVVDSTGKVAGRGAYVCASEACLSLVQKQRRFERALSVTQEQLSANLFAELKSLSAQSALDEARASAETNSQV